MGPYEPGLRVAGGVDAVTDQVKRRAAYEAAHPGAGIYVDDAHVWHAASGLTAGSLQQLLDALEAE
ncbi:hypothetical protein [Trebonia sp.]|uniref:hypothetical protein n=1 Tax=Trebonia sp. TaxID=2767075 RepID=UPI0026242855|nr:hypothetical protein [Trebonia sp.]